MDKQLKNLSTVLEYKSLDKNKRILRGVIGTTGNLDRHGDTVNPDGWILENFLKNPVVFVNHESWQLPVGKVLEVRKIENGLEFDIQFAQGTQKADEVWTLVEQKIMNAWSVGFIVLEWGKAGDEYTIMKQELLELSIVGLPANPDALSPKQMKAVKSLQKYIETNGTQKNHQESDVHNILEKLEKRLDAIEKMVGELKDLQERNEKNILQFTKSIQPDEEIANDNLFLVLNDIQSELREKDKNIGKTLKQVNILLNLLKKE